MDFNINPQEVLEHLVQMSIALLLTAPMAFNREHATPGAGLRTFPLVALASCAYMLVGMQVYDTSGAEAKVMYGIITGIGFIGGGAILKNNNHTMGTATAASIWNTGAIGVSVAYNRYEIALVLSLTNFFILQFATPLKRTNKEESSE
ncbi:MgtC/SapB family protein [Gilvimarinus sp. SDUM040013]|uniref:Protein MgtC n=1 Tax=Gilvimarinus gilvus TaxID=3058038 RepID=A0ABU4S128_9GAMM|nr:MgtC/SapB family protein [Gilvimarinus sp. SDUM040013]MDO3388663.1 MgtC/SapB family protein [Gilvimarinus sp. SDUM040013]MDX6849558.1 MgtC/SapB family protein [Gilvimarinus sp. SDUM040013]